MTEAPAGFRNVNAEEATGVRLDKEALSNGVVLLYKGARRFPRASDGGTVTVQIFVARGGKGQRFSTFGTAQLDSKLRNVKKESVIWIRYGGKKLIDGQDTHDWAISDAGARLDAAKVADLCKNSEPEHIALDKLIAVAIAEQESRRAASVSSTAAPEYDEREFTDEEAEQSAAR